MQILELQKQDYEEAKYSNNTDNIFRNIQKYSTAFIIWRIDEHQRVVGIPKEQYGTFYKNEAYIIYAAFQKGQCSGIDTASREVRSGNFEYHVHFWLGSKISSVHSSVAAYKVLLVDEQLGYITTQHREAQGNESNRFKSYFKNGIRVWNTKELEETPKSCEAALYEITGRQIPIVTQKSNISWKYFCSNHVFLIVTPKNIFIWIGQASNGVIKLHAIKAALSFKADLNVPKITFVNDGYEKTLNESDRKEFGDYLSLENRIVAPQDSQKMLNEDRGKHILRLYHCSDNNSKYRIVEIKAGLILQSDLGSKDVYILDNGIKGVWIWVGKDAEEIEKAHAIRNARGFVKKKNYPNETNVTRVVENYEPLEFKVLFFIWKENGSGPKAAKPPLVKFDASLMYERPSLAADLQLVDDGSGLINIWKVTNSGMVELLRDSHGVFYSGDCYLISYIYNDVYTRSFIYYWLGSQASDEIAVRAKSEASEMNRQLMNGNSVVVRVIEDQEPPHFLQLFRGKLTIYKGKSDDFDSDIGRSFKKQSHCLLEVVGSTTYTAKAIQVQSKATSLNSNYCYVLNKKKHCYIWCGCHSTGDQREIAKGFVNKEFDIIMEGKEPQAFWDDIGDGKPDPTVKIVPVSGNYRPPRLFKYCANSSNFEEICNFTQNDLVPEDIMLLDANHTVFIWLGDLNAKNDRKLSLQIATNYLKLDPVYRNSDLPVVEISQGYEPPIFTGFFSSWSNEYFSTYKSFEQARNEIEGKSQTSLLKERNISTDNGKFHQYVKYPVNILTTSSDKLPAKVDPLKRELHLTHDDFVTLFSMDYGVFENLPKWKQSELKKKAGLF